MGWMQDLLQQVPLSAVMKERIALVEQKYQGAIQEVEYLKKWVAALERENADLRAQIPHREEASLGEDTARVLVQIFKAKEIDERDVGNMALALNMDRSVMQYHLDRLAETELAEMTSFNYLHEHTYWGLTPKGRQYVVERKLI
jgi:DNA-binding transcriptional ArsR family regulator